MYDTHIHTFPFGNETRRAHDGVAERRLAKAGLSLVLPVQDTAGVEGHDGDVVLSLLFAQPGWLRFVFHSIMTFKYIYTRICLSSFQERRLIWFSVSFKKDTYINI